MARKIPEVEGIEELVDAFRLAHAQKEAAERVLRETGDKIRAEVRPMVWECEARGVPVYTLLAKGEASEGGEVQRVEVQFQAKPLDLHKAPEGQTRSRAEQVKVLLGDELFAQVTREDTTAVLTSKDMVEWLLAAIPGVEARPDVKIERRLTVTDALRERRCALRKVAGAEKVVTALEAVEELVFATPIVKKR